MHEFDNYDIGQLMALYARTAKRLKALQVRIDLLNRYIKEKI